MLNDSRRGVVGDYGRGWAGFLEPDTITLELTLEQSTDLDAIDIGVCHSPHDWVIRPEHIMAQWSRDGRQWSAWQKLDLPHPPDTDTTASVRLRYTIHPQGANDIRLVRIRFYGHPFLPSWHPYAGKPSWLMVDEVEIFSR